MTESKTNIDLSDEEVRFIAIFRAIKDFGKENLISRDDVGIALSLLREVVPNLEQLEKKLKPAELKLFLRGFVSGLGASKVPEVSYQAAEAYSNEHQFNGADVGIEP